MNSGTGPRLAHGGLLFLSAFWCGAMTFFASFGARIVLTTATSKSAAGPINRALIEALDVMSYVMAVLLFAAALVLKRHTSSSRFGVMLRLLILGAAAAVASQAVITPRMVSLREKMPMVIDVLSPADPMRKAWGRLHAMSSLSLGIRILAAAGLFVLAYPVRPRRSLPAFSAEDGT